MKGLKEHTAQETAERRQVTVLHVDIVNSTEIVDRLDPEQVMKLMQNYLNKSRKIIEGFDGVLSGYTGDGFEAYFGYPVAKEDVAVDAINAAIAIQDMLARPEELLPFKCRIGIATGRVVVDRPGIAEVGRNVLAFGAVPHLATRFEQAAKPGSILVDKSTMRMAAGQFAFVPIGMIQLKGFAESFEAWEVAHSLAPAKRFAVTGLTSYVGRQAEIQLLISRWQSALNGEGQVVSLVGEPGIGKSRLVYEFEKALRTDSRSFFRFQCLSQFASTPLHPWIQNVRRFAAIQDRDTQESKLEKLSAYLTEKLGLSEQARAICTALMGLDSSLDTGQREYSRQNMLSILQSELLDNIIAHSKSSPVLIHLEDVQWIDASTLNLVQALVEVAHKYRLMIIMTCRPTGYPSFSHSNVTTLKLTKLDNGSARELAANLAARNRRSLDVEVLDSIRVRSDGNPLFIEELTKHYLELAGTALDLGAMDPEQAVPEALQGLLMARIDNAGKSKQIAQLASVIGKSFESRVLIDLSEQTGHEVEQQLENLTRLGIIECLSHAKGSSYEFCHALLRDAIYLSLLSTTRSRLHLEIAEYFWHGQGERAPSEIIAHHLESGGDQENACHHWLFAGQHALHAGATEEAADLLAKALKLSSALSETPDNLEKMAVMYSAYGVALNASRGIAADPIKYHRKAEELSTRINQTELTLEALDWQFGLHFNAGELLASKVPSLKIKDLGIKLNHIIAVASGCQGLGMTEFMLGNFAEAKEQFDLGLKIAENNMSTIHCFPSMSLSYLAWTLYVLGEEAKARECAKRAVQCARNESPHALATALSNCSYVYQSMRSTAEVYELTGELLHHTKHYGEHMYFRRAMILRAWADCVTNDADEPLGEIESNINFLLQAKEEIETTFLLGVLADLQIRFGRFMEAAGSLERAIEIALNNEEKFYLAELYRLKDMLSRVQPQRFVEPRADYLAMAKELAFRQHAIAWLHRLTA